MRLGYKEKGSVDPLLFSSPRSLETIYSAGVLVDHFRSYYNRARRVRWQLVGAPELYSLHKSSRRYLKIKKLDSVITPCILMLIATARIANVYYTYTFALAFYLWVYNIYMSAYT